MSCLPLGAWLFGKMPAHGDFVSRGLDAPLRDALDDWLSQEVATAREMHGEAFESRFDQAPLVKFVDRDEAGRIAGGTLCASVDSVGRRFALMTGAPAGDMGAAHAAADRCETAVYAAFAGRLDADSLHRQLAGAPGGDTHDAAGESRWWVDGVEPGEEIWSRAGRFPTGIVAELLRIAT